MAAVGGLPLVVDLDEDGTDETDHGWVVGEDAHHVGPSLDLLVHPLERIGGGDLLVVGTGEVGIGSDVVLSLVEHGGGPHKALPGCRPQLGGGPRVAAASGWANTVRTVAATISADARGTLDNTLRMRRTLHLCQEAPENTRAMRL